MKIKVGDKITIKGVAWNAQWEFGCPIVLYSGLRRYTPNANSICKDSILRFVEDALVDAVVDGEISDAWSPSDLREFDWRGWSIRGFRRRKGVHLTVVATFTADDYGELSFVVEETGVAA